MILILLDEAGQLCEGILYGAAKKALLPFIPYQIIVRKRQGLSLFEKMEPLEKGVTLTGRRLYCGFYINELVMYLAKGLDNSSDFQNYYRSVLNKLAKTDEPLMPILRHFEWILVALLGYEIDFSQDKEGAPRPG